MKNLLILALFSLLFLSVSPGELQDKAPPGVDVLSYSQGDALSVEIFATNDMNKTEAVAVRRHDRRAEKLALTSKFEPRPKSLWLYGHLLYETKDQESETTNRLDAIEQNRLVFKTEYG